MEDEIANLIAYWDWENKTANQCADAILSLLAPVFADAGKWRKVEEIAKRNWYDGYPCDGCPVENCCDSADSLCGQADALVQALTGKEPR